MRVMRFEWRRLAVFLMVGAFLALAVGQVSEKKKPEDELAEWIRASYTKYEYRVPMRDGVRLFTSVYVPKDASEQMCIRDRARRRR